MGSSINKLGLGLAAAVVAFVSGAASATPYTFDFTNKGNLSGTQTFNLGGTGGLSVKVSAWHAADANKGAVNANDTISAATLGLWQGYGMGVSWNADKSSDGTHQIDNVGSGTDFVMLQFSKDVTLTSIGRNPYTISGSCCASDASYWADTGHVLGAPSASSSIDLTTTSSGLTVDESLWTLMAGKSVASVMPTNSSNRASVWLVAAAMNQKDDAFKLSSITADTPSPAPVPEPASWAMMIGGFGAVGAAMRRQRAKVAFAA